MRGRETRKREQGREQKPGRDQGQAQERMAGLVDRLVRALLPQRQQGQAQERSK